MIGFVPDPTHRSSFVSSPDTNGRVEVFSNLVGDTKCVSVAWYCGEVHTYPVSQVREIIADLEAIKDHDSWLFVPNEYLEWLYLRVVGRYLYVATEDIQAEVDMEYLKGNLRDQRVSWVRLKTAIEKVLG